MAKVIPSKSRGLAVEFLGARVLEADALIDLREERTLRSTETFPVGADGGGDLASSSVERELRLELRVRARKLVLGTLRLEYVLGRVDLPRRWCLASAGEEARAGGDDDAGRVGTSGPEDGNCAFLSCTSSGSVFGVMLDMMGVAERVVSDDVLEPFSDTGAVEGIGVEAFLNLDERRDALCWEESGTTDADDGSAG